MATATATSTATAATSTATATLYNYSPSKTGPIVVAALFGVTLVPHFYYLFRYKARYMIPFVIGVVGEVGGYVFRYFTATHNVDDDEGDGYATGSQLLIILSPAFLAATHYMIYGRLVDWVGEKHSIIRSKWVTKIFVFFDIASFCVQGAGGSVLSGTPTPKMARIGRAVLIVGFVIQIVSFAIFAVFAYIFQRRARLVDRYDGTPNWVKVLRLLYTGTIIILIRSVFRTLEFGTENMTTSRGPFVDNEGWSYSLEATPILLVCILFAAYSPAKLMPSDRSARLETTSMRKEKSSTSQIALTSSFSPEV